MFISDVFTGQRVLNVDSLTTEKCIPQTLQTDQVFISKTNNCECIVDYSNKYHHLIFTQISIFLFYSGKIYKC